MGRGRIVGVLGWAWRTQPTHVVLRFSFAERDDVTCFKVASAQAPNPPVRGFFTQLGVYLRL